MGLLRPGLVSHPVDRAVDFGRPLSAEAFRRKIASAARGLAGTGPVAGQYMACRWCCMAAYRGVLAIISGRLAEPDAAADGHRHRGRPSRRSEEHTSELQSLMRICYAVFGLKKKT